MLSRTRLAAAVAACAALVLVSGCGSDEEAAPSAETSQSETPTSSSSSPSDEAGAEPDLEEYVAQAEKVSKSMLADGVAKLYSSIDIKPSPPSGIEYVFVFKQPVDVASARDRLAAQEPVLKASYDTQIKPEMERYGFEDPTATWTYENPDGTVVFTKTFP